MPWYKLILFTLSGLILNQPAESQDLFNSLISDSDKSQTQIISINGYTRGTVFTGRDFNDKADIKNIYGETSLQLYAKPNATGGAFTDIRFRTGFSGERYMELDIREAYAYFYLKNIDIKLGKQISTWGRADAFNPTRNLSPYNYFFRSPLEDDKRMGNFMLSGVFSPLPFLKLELDWVPVYIPSVYEFDQLDMPDFVVFNEAPLPGNQLSNSSFGGKIDLTLNKFEGSASYFSGYDALRGLNPGILPLPPFENFSVELLSTPYRQSTIGADFAFNIGSTGLRGEFAWKIPGEDDSNPSIPMEEMNIVIGMDKAFGAFRMMLEYSGKKIMGFDPIPVPKEFDPALLQDPNNWISLMGQLDNQIKFYNRILFDQSKEYLHSLVFRPSVSLFHETLNIESVFLYNISTQEYMLRPMVNYDIADNINLCAGYEHFYGDPNTRFNWVKKVFSGPFLELKISY